MTYNPVPLDNSGVTLSEELKRLIEMLARNNHDLWGKRRMEEGWMWGALKDGTKKETPLLVPYEELPQSEKEYDRSNAVETLRTILALGYRIEPPSGVEGA